jgi:hypothetical protein
MGTRQLLQQFQNRTRHVSQIGRNCKSVLEGNLNPAIVVVHEPVRQSRSATHEFFRAGVREATNLVVTGVRRDAVNPLAGAAKPSDGCDTS